MLRDNNQSGDNLTLIEAFYTNLQFTHPCRDIKICALERI